LRLYIGLVHYPVYNKRFEPIASAVTTVDLHDIGRLARTYDAKRVVVINPLRDQQKLAESVCRHWTEGYGAAYNRYRKQAFELIDVVENLDRAIELTAEAEGKRPLIIATSAAPQQDRVLSYTEARGLLESNRPVLMLFGTAWGLERSLLDLADYTLEPIVGRGAYNHLSVRAAAAIILDRLAGQAPR